jgi:uncharacterized membrane protein YozB (DUF420 family)
MIAMCLALAVVFGFEMLGVFTDRYVTITAIVRQTVPLWARAMILGWLCYHFMIQ